MERKATKSLSIPTTPTQYFDFGASHFPSPTSSHPRHRRIITTFPRRHHPLGSGSPQLHRIMQLDDMVNSLHQTRTNRLRMEIEAAARSQSELMRELKKLSRLDREARRKAIWMRIEAAKVKEEKMTEKEVKKVVTDLQRELKRFVFK